MPDPRIVISIQSGVPIPSGTVTIKAPQTGKKYQKMILLAEKLKPNWVKWTFSSPEECRNAIRYLRYFFKDRNQIELRFPKNAMIRLVRSCFLLMRVK